MAETNHHLTQTRLESLEDWARVRETKDELIRTNRGRRVRNREEGTMLLKEWMRLFKRVKYR